MDWNDIELSKENFHNPLRVEENGSIFKKIICQFVCTQLVMVEVFEFRKTGKRGRPAAISKRFYWHGEYCPYLDFLANINREILAKQEKEKLLSHIPMEKKNDKSIRRL